MLDLGIQQRTSQTQSLPTWSLWSGGGSDYKCVWQKQKAPQVLLLLYNVDNTGAHRVHSVFPEHLFEHPLHARHSARCGRNPSEPGGHSPCLLEPHSPEADVSDTCWEPPLFTVLLPPNPEDGAAAESRPVTPIGRRGFARGL